MPVVTAPQRCSELHRLGLPRGRSGKEPACQRRGHKRCGFDPWVKKIPWRRQWPPIENSMDRGTWGLQSTGSQRVGRNERLSTHACHSLIHTVPLSVHPSSCSWMILRILQFSAQRSPLPLSTCALNPAPGVMDVMRICCRQLLLRHAFPRCAHPVWSGPVLDVC